MKGDNIRVNVGDVFKVPLRNGGIALGLVARKKGSIALGYFWDHHPASELSDYDKLLVKDSVVWIKQFGILGLQNGSWEILGSLSSFSIKHWPVPKFVHDRGMGDKMLMTFDDNLCIIDEQTFVSTENSSYPSYGIAGYGFVEIKLGNVIDALHKK